MKLIRFKLFGRIGHFLRAEAYASAPSYPVPPRTALLGLVGAILGLEKDQPQVALRDTEFAVAGTMPPTHWHRAKLRKKPPQGLPWTIKQNQKTDKQTKPEHTGLVTQEWLVNPEYTVWVHLPEAFHGQFEVRLRERRWHFTPCMGLSEMLADLVFEETVTAQKLPMGIHEVGTVFPRELGDLNTDALYARELALLALRMPHAVTADRVFSHRAYYMERTARPVPVQTDDAYQAGQTIVAFL